MRSLGSVLACLICLWTLACLNASAVRAQEISATDRAAASDAYDRGTSAFVQRDFSRAATWFETAFRMAPSDVALLQAVRSRFQAGDVRQAANLIRVFEARYQTSATEHQSEMASILQTARSTSYRVEVRCAEPCTLEVDGGIVAPLTRVGQGALEGTDFDIFLTPNDEHRLSASFASGQNTTPEQVTGRAGGSHSLSLTPIAAPTETPPPQSSGLDPFWAIASITLTAGAAGALVWSTWDMYEGVPAYEREPSIEGLRDGQMREVRTDVLIGVTAGLAGVSILLTALTHWGGDESTDANRSERVQLDIYPTLGGGAINLRRHF